MHYNFSYNNPHKQYIDIEFTFSNVNSKEVLVRLPRWRPGRYELGNFAKNIQKFEVKNESGIALKFEKIEKDAWLIQSDNAKSISIYYNYYAAEMTAGSSYLSDDLFYVNPVNCCLYLPDRMDEKCIVNIDLPEYYTVATGLKNESTFSFLAENFQQLADCPIMAAKDLNHNHFIYEGIDFHIWIKGLEKPDWSKILSDFFLYTHEQYEVFKSFPVKEYHYLFIFLPYKYHHGVEHQNSTVIVMGPKYDIYKATFYNEVLGVSSHELFHTWNIKTIRPVEMLPYDFSKENYSQLGFVYEGLTTYYGDLMLYRARVFSDREYFETFNNQLQKHFDNFGRKNMSVAASSFDTWLDGYVAGVPNRKVSIYTEGCLLAFVTDILIRKFSKNNYSLDDVARHLYEQFAQKNKGYTYADYKATCEHYAGGSLNNLFENYISGTADYQNIIEECLLYIGISLSILPSPSIHQSIFGIKLLYENGKALVSNVYPDSPADIAGIAVGDEIKFIEKNTITNNAEEWFAYYNRLRYQSINVTVSRFSQERNICLNKDGNIYYKRYEIQKLTNPDNSQKYSYNSWCKREFSIDKA
jgi:predicted metalloprotease with PDZ domain